MDMMICENDKFNIPEKYRKMSVSELRHEKERIYLEIKKNSTGKKKTVKCSSTITFNF